MEEQFMLEEFDSEPKPEAEEVVIEEKPVKKSKPKKENVRMKIAVIRAFVFSKPNVHSRSVAALSHGNLVQLLEEGDVEDEFHKIRVPRGENSIEGYVLKTKLKKV